MSMSNGENARVHIRISGQVQGVYYRASASEQARVLGLVGWVRNLPGGEVELLAEGPQAQLEQLVTWCHLGPPAARVESVQADYAAASGEFHEFRVQRG